jgi:hypothetical protein
MGYAHSYSNKYGVDIWRSPGKRWMICHGMDARLARRDLTESFDFI